MPRCLIVGRAARGLSPAQSEGGNRGGDHCTPTSVPLVDAQEARCPSSPVHQPGAVLAGLEEPLGLCSKPGFLDSGGF